MKKTTWMTSLTLALLACAALTPAFAAEPAAAPTQPAPAVETPSLCDGQTAGATGAPAFADLFVPKPLQMDPPICNPMCITSQCTSNSECTAQPGGRCAPACPHVGCCVY
jgi:hypothetical protein